MRRNWHRILGKQDTPTDAVEEYCRYLGEAMQAEDYDFENRTSPWVEHGWGAAGAKASPPSPKNGRTWVLVQYTALGGPRGDLPMRFARVLKTLKPPAPAWPLFITTQNRTAGRG